MKKLALIAALVILAGFGTHRIDATTLLASPIPTPWVSPIALPNLGAPPSEPAGRDREPRATLIISPEMVRHQICLATARHWLLDERVVCR